MNKTFLFISRFKPSLLILLVISLTLGCSSKYAENIDRGDGYNYRPGFPEFRVAVTGHVTEQNDPIIIVAGEIVYESMIFTSQDDFLNATAQIEIILKKTDGEDFEGTALAFEENIRSKDNEVVNSQEVLKFEKQFQVIPGEYLVQTVVTDKSTGKQTIRAYTTNIPDPNDEVPHITEIRIMGKDSDLGIDDNNFEQATTYDIPSLQDSLKFIFQVTNNSPDEPLELEARLIRFRTDSSVARPMTFNNLSPSSIVYKGIDYDNYDVIQSSTRSLSQPGSVVIEYVFSELPRGNYRLEVLSNEGTEEELYKARDFAIKSPHYPSLRTPDELARPLQYIMSDSEFEELMSITDPEELKQTMDRFWLSNIQNSNLARSIISHYYQRVEDANKLFSNFKEGWKTDMGMIYILFGPPYFETKSLNEIRWSYTYDMTAPEYNFYFKRNKSKSDFYPFEHYILQRDNVYFQLEYRIRQLWLSGKILTATL